MASSSKPGKIYHVFLSFRGEDVRNNFLGHLYGALDQKGIYTYVDSEELRKGEQIAPALMKAIEESQIAIIIFSKDYASSWWCLEELARIMDCKKKRALLVFPLFYKVEPREMRTPRERYRKAMIKHESKFGKDSKEVKRWEKALSDAGNLSGWHLKDGDESKLIQRIGMEISTRLNRTLLHVATHPVGIDSQVVKLKSMLNLESNDDVLMVGLWGQGGIGKTTLAKAVYNDIFNQFRNSCFLANVREVSKDCKDLVTLQEKLLLEILALKERLVVSNVDRGINLIQERLCHKKVLLILDDVDDLRQLHALIGEGKWFGNGSRIIVTTRDSHLLTYLGIDQDHVYHVKELDDSEARELLSKHAFPTHQQLKIKKDLVDNVLNHAKGLPLALEVLGSFLRGRGEQEWESTLKKLSRIPNNEIMNVLKISYDGLDEDQKEIFLHIACFFKGWDEGDIKKVLDSCDFEATIGLKVLFERSLIRFEWAKLQMHDLIQSMGMDIVRQECRDDPGRRSRLWQYDDIVDVLSRDMGDCAVKAIVLELPEPTEMWIDPDAFTKMRRLRLVILRNVHNSFHGPICLPNELRWFKWPGCDLFVPESSSGRNKLVGLDVSKSNITALLKRFKVFRNMKYINFSECELLVSIPDLSCTPNLEKLKLKNCKNLVEAHKSIAYHDNLQVLTLKGCSELSVFTNELKPRNLRALNLGNCTKLESFPDIPQKLGLEKLILHGTAIRELPTSIENLVALEKMDVRDCKNLVSLPSSIYKLQNIEELILDGCTKLIGFPNYEDSADPHMKTGLSKLRLLDLEGCNLSEVKFLENLSCCPSLDNLILSGNKITSLPTSINKRNSLTGFVVADCHQLREIPELPPSLGNFLANNCESLQKIGEFTSTRDFVRSVLTMDRTFSRGQRDSYFAVLLPGEEMPEWIIPVEKDFISFTASKDLYDKFFGFMFCAVVSNDKEIEEGSINARVRVNDEARLYSGQDIGLLDSNHIWLSYMQPKLGGGIGFRQIEESYVKFHLRVFGNLRKKWGFRIICKQLDDDLEGVLQDNQKIDPAFFYEVSHDSTDSAAESSLVQTEIHLQKDLDDRQMSAKKHKSK